MHHSHFRDSKTEAQRMDGLSKAAIKMRFFFIVVQAVELQPGYTKILKMTGKDIINNWIDRKCYLRACQRPITTLSYTLN